MTNLQIKNGFCALQKRASKVASDWNYLQQILADENAIILQREYEQTREETFKFICRKFNFRQYIIGGLVNKNIK